MLLRLLKLRFLKAVRSVSLSRKLVTGIFLLVIGLIVLSNILLLGLSLDKVVTEVTDTDNVIRFINTYLVFFFLSELIYRLFLQKITPIELGNYLHLPIGRSTIMHFVLSNSFITALNIVVVLLFAPFAFTKLQTPFGLEGALSWLLTVCGISWSIHWFILWFKQKFSDGIGGVIVLFAIYTASFSGLYYDWLNIGTWLAPFFSAAVTSWFPFLVVLFVGSALYMLTYSYYNSHAYLEELQKKKSSSYLIRNISAFERFGIAGAMADLELKLILRHKRPRTLLAVSPLFLLYGLTFYGDQDFTEGIPWITIFVGIFITGTFLMNYGQYFLSWNSAYLDFFSSRYQGIKGLVTGKYLLFAAISLIYFLLSIPYVYFGWQVFFIHAATFLFNMGVTIHFITYIALWKPKPIDISKGAMFNYEGMGAAQFLIAIPVLILPYVVYLPVSLFFNGMVGLAMLAITGMAGILFYERLIDLQVKRITKNKYQIGSSFRQEL